MTKKIFSHQIWHALCLLILFIGVSKSIENYPSILNGSLFGYSSYTWLIISMLSPIVHQLYVLFCWRSELYYKYLSKNYGKNAFIYYKKIFTVLILSRPIFILLLSISNSNSLYIWPVFYWAIIILLLIPGIYSQYSVAKYFGYDRAFGIDHFEPEIYNKIPLVNDGIFKYTSNGMYVYAFFLIWLPGIIFESQAGILLALFHHLYIWVHYYFTELPDIRYIYGKK